MYQTHTVKQKFVLFFKMLWPILITQIGYNAMNVCDTMMSGRSGTYDLAGVAIGSSLWMPVLIGLNGILMAVTPIIAQMFGSGQYEKIPVAVTQAIYLCLVLALVVVGAGTLFLQPILGQMNLDSEVHSIAYHYLIGISFGLFPLFASNVVRNFFDAQGHTKITMFITLIAVPFNILLNYLLIFGKFGFPELGGVGAGYATAITYWLILIISIGMTFRVESVRPYRLFLKWFAPSLRAWKEQLQIGVPIGLSIFFEVSIFATVTLLMGMLFDTEIIAAHQAAINFASIVFMIPLSISMTLTILVAYEVGSKRLKDARQYTRIGVGSALVIIGICMIFLYLCREQIAYLYSSDPAVVALTMQFLVVAIFYQFSDAAQASLQGVLRGYKDVTVPFITALISYWLIGMPSGYFLSVYTELGPFGFWAGITIGLTCAALGFFLRLRMVQSRVYESKAA